MSIVSMKIKNFKSISEAEINFKGNLSGIYGPNGTGKTAVVEAIKLIKDYYTSVYTSSSGNILKDKISEYMKIGENFMEIEIVFQLENSLYKLVTQFKKENNQALYVSKEELYFKEEANSRKFFKPIIEMSSDDIVPKILFQKRKNLDVDIEKVWKASEITAKNISVEFNEFKSYLSLLFRQITMVKDEKDLSEDLKLFADIYSKIEERLLELVVITLKEQALYNLDILIPLNVHSNKMHGTLLVNYRKGGGIYSEEQAKEIENVVSQISDIFSIIVPKSKLEIEKTIEQLNEKEKKVGINLFVIKDDKKIALEQESTGIIKLVSLLSAMLYYVQNKKAIVVIDELDIHIFEYLLAILLQELSKIARGQLIFTAHNLLPMEKLNKDSIIISTKNDDNKVIYTYLKGVSATTNLRQKYLKSQRMWSEDNIEPLLLNSSALELYIKKLVL